MQFKRRDNTEPPYSIQRFKYDIKVNKLYPSVCNIEFDVCSGRTFFIFGACQTVIRVASKLWL